jgi:hypothetical protein
MQGLKPDQYKLSETGNLRIDRSTGMTEALREDVREIYMCVITNAKYLVKFLLLYLTSIPEAQN